MKSILIAFVFSSWSHVTLAGDMCFYKHVEEAIVLNKDRLPKYIALDARSKKVSQKMIAMETLLLPFAFLLDKSVKSYQQKGVPLGCIEFIDIAETPEFQEVPLKGVLPISEGTRPFGKKRLKGLLAALDESNYSLAFKEANQVIHEMEEQFPHHFCLCRHFLESIRRITYFAPIHINESLERGLPRPTRRINDLIQIHRIGLWSASSIDKLAIPLQNKGIPIICNDVPYIPAS